MNAMQIFNRPALMAKSYLDGIEHDPSAKWARTMAAAQEGLGWTHEYCHETYTDFLMTPDGGFFQVSRGDGYLQHKIYEIVRDEIEYLVG